MKVSNEDDPFYSMIGMMRKEGMVGNTVPFLIGTISSTDPLLVRVMGNQIGRENLKINTFLLEGYERRMQLATTQAVGQTTSRSGGGGYDAFASHEHAQSTIGIPDGTFTTMDAFAIGDEVLLLVSEDGQQYVLVCKLA